MIQPYILGASFHVNTRRFHYLFYGVFFGPVENRPSRSDLQLGAPRPGWVSRCWPESSTGGWARAKGQQSLTRHQGAPAAVHALLVPATFSFYDSLITGPKGQDGGGEE